MPRHRAAATQLPLLQQVVLMVVVAVLALLDPGGMAPTGVAAITPATLASLVPLQKRFLLQITGSHWDRVYYRLAAANASVTPATNPVTDAVDTLLREALRPIPPTAAAPSPPSGIAAVGLTEPPLFGVSSLVTVPWRQVRENGLWVSFTVTRLFPSGADATTTLSDAEVVRLVTAQGNLTTLRRLFEAYGGTQPSAMGALLPAFTDSTVGARAGDRLIASAAASAVAEIPVVGTVLPYAPRELACDTSCVYSLGVIIPLIIVVVLAAPICVSITIEGTAGPNIVMLLVKEDCDAERAPLLRCPLEEPLYVTLPETKRKTDNVHLDGLVIVADMSDKIVSDEADTR